LTLGPCLINLLGKKLKIEISRNNLVEALTMEDYWSKHCECGVPILGKDTGGHESWTTRYCIIWRVASKHTIYIYVRIYIYIYIYIYL
jgi:hypothetical protein